MMNGDQFVDLILDAAKKQKDPPVFAMGTCKSLNTGTGSVSVELDTADAARSFPALSSAGTIESNQRVLLARVGSNYVVLGKIRS